MPHDGCLLNIEAIFFPIRADSYPGNPPDNALFVGVGRGGGKFLELCLTIENPIHSMLSTAQPR